MLLPALAGAKKKATRTVCTNNMKQLGLAILNYESSNRVLPLAYTPNYTGQKYAGSCPLKPGLPGNPSNKIPAQNVLSFILPYMEQQSLYDQIDFGRSWDSLTGATGRTPNFRVVKANIADFVCPSAPGRTDLYVSDYAVLAFINEAGYCGAELSGLAATKRDTSTLTGLLDDTPISIRKVTDGLSKTLMLFEDAGRPIYFERGAETPLGEAVGPLTQLYNTGGMAPEWANPGQYFGYGNTSTTGCGLTTIMNCTNHNEVYSFHPGGCVFLYGDGGAGFISENMDVDTYISLVTRDANDVVSASR